MKERASKKSKQDGLDKIRQNIFTAKTDKEKKMWQLILKRILDEQDKSGKA